ncbi:MAG: ABC transporter ATP-binding protein [Flavobacteriales bacterium]|nr:ABC transporter ATP-binding protein [Flavobacteriales bacterium]
MKKGETFALLGESGSGKSTLLRIICGLEIPDAGELTIGGSTFNAPGTFVKPEKRNIGLVFQDNALFPHLNVFKNIAFGVSRKSNKKEIVEELISTTKLSGLENRMPHELSGGQQQRVAIARALAIQPSLLLLDEPFSTLDHSLKNEIRDEVKQIIKDAGISCIIVTHHIDDATSMADRIAILQQGKLIQLATPKEIYDRPVNEYVAKLFGTVNELNGNIFRSEDVLIGAGSKEGLVTAAYFENGHYVVHLNHESRSIKALSHERIEIGEMVKFEISKHLSFTVK